MYVHAKYMSNHRLGNIQFTEEEPSLFTGDGKTEKQLVALNDFLIMYCHAVSFPSICWLCKEPLVPTSSIH